MNRPVHFEIHASDQDAMQKFYEAVFGWKFQNMGEALGNYRLIMTGPGPDEMAKGVRMEDVGINGGMNPRRGAKPADGQPVNGFICTMSVPNLDESMKKVEGAGGTIALGKMSVPSVGWLAYCKDPDGNIFGMMQPDPNAPMQPPPQTENPLW